MRKSTLFLLTLTSGILLLAVLLALDSARLGPSRHRRAAAARDVARQLRITDPCLFTEARYTRHLSMADLHAPLQEHPLGLEHFPSGSFVKPPKAFGQTTESVGPDGGREAP
ncbi:MAG: hypothetical protein ACOWWM_10255 [Desulfobacterales bacterium]